MWRELGMHMRKLGTVHGGRCGLRILPTIPHNQRMASPLSLPNAKDLTKEAPRSPRVRLGGYALLARMIDKGRAFLVGKNGEYNFDCPLDEHLLSFKGVTGDQVRQLLASGAGDEEIVHWFNQNGTPRTAEEIERWSAEEERGSLHGHPEKGAWFDEQCRSLGLDPATASLFDMLEADDRVSFHG